jgi:signal transduction histidine kinase
MGLTVARHSLRNIGGDVSMEDRPGGGTIAVLLHPVAQRKRRTISE